jgi:predicted nucleic acid-binding Zn finger protein
VAESVATKADRYLTEGRVIVLSLSQNKGEFEVQGSETYSLTAVPWTCTCPARVEECAHILACKKITSFAEAHKVNLMEDNTAWLEDLLSS